MEPEQLNAHTANQQPGIHSPNGAEPLEHHPSTGPDALQEAVPPPPEAASREAENHQQQPDESAGREGGDEAIMQATTLQREEEGTKADAALTATPIPDAEQATPTSAEAQQDSEKAATPSANEKGNTEAAHAAMPSIDDSGNAAAEQSVAASQDGSNEAEMPSANDESRAAETTPAMQEPAPENHQVSAGVQPPAPAATLEEWWANATFPGKEFTTLNPDGALHLNATQWSEARPLTTLSPATAADVVKTMTDRFDDVANRVAELAKEWDAAEDKQKLNGKVTRMADYLGTSNALGNYGPLLEKTASWQDVLKTQSATEEATALAIVEKAESLAGSEDWKEATQTYRDLADQWRTLPQAERHRYDALYKRLNAAKDTFFDRKRQHSEEIEKELMVNYDRKLEIVEKAENIAASEKWKESTEILRHLTDEWKTIGRTSAEKTAQLWARFSAAKDVFYDRKKQHFEAIEKEQDENYHLKEELVMQAESWANNTDWQKTSQRYATLLEQWKKTGRVPMEKADVLWARLNAAKDTFFNNKRRYFDTQRVELEDNLAQKQALIKHAESMRNSTQWRETTEELNELMEEWKKIGPVPREQNNAIWELFLAARKYFFERKDQDRDRRMERITATANQRTQDARNALDGLRAEVKEEEEKLADFRQAIGNITPGPKADELRSHLEQLIPQTEKTLARLQQQLLRAEKEAAGGNDRNDRGDRNQRQPRQGGNRDNNNNRNQRQSKERNAQNNTARQQDSTTHEMPAVATEAQAGNNPYIAAPAQTHRNAEAGVAQDTATEPAVMQDNAADTKNEGDTSGMQQPNNAAAAAGERPDSLPATAENLPEGASEIAPVPAPEEAAAPQQQDEPSVNSDEATHDARYPEAAPQTETAAVAQEIMAADDAWQEPVPAEGNAATDGQPEPVANPQDVEQANEAAGV